MHGERRGPQWMVEREELERFAKEHDSRLAQTRAAVSATRRHEREGRLIVRAEPVAPAYAARSASRVRSSYARRVRNEAIAIGIALAVTGSAVTASESETFLSAAREAADTSFLAATGAREAVYAYGESLRVSASRAERTATVHVRMDAGYAPLTLPNLPEIPASESFIFSRDTDLKTRSAAVTANRERIVTVPSVGEAGLVVGTYVRDRLARIPVAAHGAAVSTGGFFAGIPEHALSLHLAVIQGFVELPAPISRFTIGSLLSVGEATRSLAASMPARTIALYGDGAKALSELGPRALTSGVQVEIALGKTLMEASHATSRMALEPIVRVAAFAPRLGEGATYLKEQAREVALSGDTLAQIARASADVVLTIDAGSLASAVLTTTYEPLARALGSVQAAIGSLSYTVRSGAATSQTEPYTPQVGAPVSNEEDGRVLINAPHGGEYLWTGSVTESASMVRERLGVRELERAAEDGASLRRIDGSELQIDPLAPLVEIGSESDTRSSSWIADTVDRITGAMEKENAERICIEDRCYTKDDVIRLLNESGAQ